MVLSEIKRTLNMYISEALPSVVNLSKSNKFIYVADNKIAEVFNALRKKFFILSYYIFNSSTPNHFTLYTNTYVNGYLLKKFNIFLAE